MEKVIHGNLKEEGLEIVERKGRYFVRYDAGAHQIAWREDEITKIELEKIQLSSNKEYEVIIAIQERIKEMGGNPYKQNWSSANTDLDKNKR